MTAVLADANPEVQWLLSDKLRRSGIDVLGTAGSSSEAGACVHRWQPDVVVLDDLLPGDVLLLCRRLVVDLPALRVLLHAGVVTDRLLRQAVLSGVHSVVPKSLLGNGLTHAVLGRPVPGRRDLRP